LRYPDWGTGMFGLGVLPYKEAMRLILSELNAFFRAWTRATCAIFSLGFFLVFDTAT
jgi:hypothetical protein